MTHQFHPSIFREYDIRGVVGETLFAGDAYQIGLNYAATLGKGRVCVGYDGRLSSVELAEALIGGLTDGGLDVVNIGLVPTPLTYFSVFHMDADGGIMVTGSHNPPTHNGFKLMLGKDSMFGSEIAALSKVEGQRSKVKGEVEKIDLRDEYLKRITLDLRPSTFDLKIGFDPGNGASGEIAARLAERLGALIINEKIDGTFPSHHPDPTVEENLEQLKAMVLDNKLDVGFAFDGDGDRLGVVNNLGRPIWGDQILAILAREVLERNPGAPIVADVKTSSAVFNYIKQCGGVPVMWKTGHSLVKAKMKELNSPLAGEMSAHIFIKDGYYGFDDGIYAAIRFLGVMVKTGKTAAELLDELPKMFSTPEMRIECIEARKFAIVDEVKAALERDGVAFSNIDGVRAETERGWWLLRASNTGNQLVARAEAESQDELDGMVDALKGYLRATGINL